MGRYSCRGIGLATSPVLVVPLFLFISLPPSPGLIYGSVRGSLKYHTCTFVGFGLKGRSVDFVDRSTSLLKSDHSFRSVWGEIAAAVSIAGDLNPLVRANRIRALQAPRGLHFLRRILLYARYVALIRLFSLGGGA